MTVMSQVMKDQIVRMVAICDQAGVDVPKDIRDHRNHIVNGREWKPEVVAK